MEVIRWYDKMKYMKTIGTLCIGGGILTAGFPVLFSWDSVEGDSDIMRFMTGLTGTVGAAFGLFLLKKKYMKDPEALFEYYLWFLDHNLLDSIEQFGWEDMVKFASTEDVLDKIDDEIFENRGFDALYVAYDLGNIKKMLDYSIYSRDDLIARYKYDNKTMTDVPVISRISNYGSWIHLILNVSNISIERLIAEDELTTTMGIRSLNQYDLHTLCNYNLINREFLREKVLIAASAASIDYTFVKDSIGRWIVDDNIVPVTDLQMLFRETVLLREEAHVIFENFWAWPIVVYGLETGLEEDEYGRLQGLQKKYIRLQRSYEEAVAISNKAYETSKHNAGRKRDATINEIKLRYKNTKGTDPAQTAAIDNAKADYETQLSEFESTRDYRNSQAKQSFENATADINEEWSEYKRKDIRRTSRHTEPASPTIIHNTTVVHNAPQTTIYNSPPNHY